MNPKAYITTSMNTKEADEKVRDDLYGEVIDIYNAIYEYSKKLEQ